MGQVDGTKRTSLQQPNGLGQKKQQLELWIHALMPLTEKGEGDREHGEGKSRERDHQQIDMIIIKVTTIE